MDNIWGAINPNKAGLFKGSCSWVEGGVQFDPRTPPFTLHISRRAYLIAI